MRIMQRHRQETKQRPCPGVEISNYWRRAYETLALRGPTQEEAQQEKARRLEEKRKAVSQ